MLAGEGVRGVEKGCAALVLVAAGLPCGRGLVWVVVAAVTASAWSLAVAVVKVRALWVGVLAARRRQRRQIILEEYGGAMVY